MEYDHSMVNSSYRLQAWHALVVLILINLILGFMIGNQYGQTWDEPSFYLYGERSYEAYMRGLAGQPLIPERHIFFLDLRYYGPFHTAMGWKFVEMLTPILKNWGYMDVWHYINFCYFQLALIAMFFLASRYLRPWVAFFLVIVFETQPLIFGHAFINPKDIPFLTFFLSSVVIGLYMVDATKLEKAENEHKVSMSHFQLLLAVLFGLFIITYVGRDLISSLISLVISKMYDAPGDSFLGGIFSVLAHNSNRLPVDNYIHKAVSAHLERIAIYLVLFVLVARKYYINYVKAGRLDFSLKFDFRSTFLVIGAGIVLGLATSIRLLAPFAGFLVVIYALGTRGRKSLPALIYYFSIAAIVCYLAWPFLWDSPAYNFLEALKVMRDFPFNAEVRFMGDNITPSDLPLYYIPLLVSIQITVPVVLLAWLGFFHLIFYTDQKKIFENLIPLTWFILPVGLQILMKSNAYDNFRQFLFILPPMFVLAGMGFETLLARVGNRIARIALPVLCVLPGLTGIVSLHPIQYIYYNGFVGGVTGAGGNFELDYWLTSYREAAPYINVHAPLNANILAWGSGFNGARKDLKIFSFGSEEDLKDTNETFEYAVISTRFDSHLGVFKDSPVVYEVRRNGALLAVVKKLTQ